MLTLTRGFPKHQQQHTRSLKFDQDHSGPAPVPDCQIVPQSPFGPSARSSAAYFCFCQSEVFHQSVCVSPLVICSLFLICTAPSTAAWLWKTSAEARWCAFLSCCCPKWGFSRLESWVEMLVNVIGSSTQSEVKSRGNDLLILAVWALYVSATFFVLCHIKPADFCSYSADGFLPEDRLYFEVFSEIIPVGQPTLWKISMTLASRNKLKYRI